MTTTYVRLWKPCLDRLAAVFLLTGQAAARLGTAVSLTEGLRRTADWLAGQLAGA